MASSPTACAPAPWCEPNGSRYSGGQAGYGTVTTINGSQWCDGCLDSARIAIEVSLTECQLRLILRQLVAAGQGSVARAGVVLRLLHLGDECGIDPRRLRLRFEDGDQDLHDDQRAADHQCGLAQAPSTHGLLRAALG
jgi:hypothetical protein